MKPSTYPSVLSIAGSDSGGCAGIQADLKSISACGSYAATVITATTAQNTQGVWDIHAIPVPHIEKQLEAVLSDISFGALKIGMLHSCEVIRCVAQALEQYPTPHIVIDPVMVATSGDLLIHEDAIACLKKLLPKATIITPNKQEAELLVGYTINLENATEATASIGKTYQTNVLLKCGPLDNTLEEVTDILYLYQENRNLRICQPKIDTQNTHGTGCSLSSSIASFLSQGEALESAVQKACKYVHEAIVRGAQKSLGQGNGPIGHFDL